MVIFEGLWNKTVFQWKYGILNAYTRISLNVPESKSVLRDRMSTAHKCKWEFKAVLMLVLTSTQTVNIIQMHLVAGDNSLEVLT